MLNTSIFNKMIKFLTSSTENIRLSETDLWNYQQKYYTDTGIKAWDNNAVPYYATNNSYIGYAYASIIFGFLNDCIEREVDLTFETFYIIEIGTGNGQFGFYTIKHLVELRKKMGMEKISFVYVMTDISLKNIKFCQEHPDLKPYIEEGLLDFSLFNILSDNSLSLLNSGKTLGAQTNNQTLPKPFIVLTNYVLDSLPQDLFRISNGKVQEVTFPKEKSSAISSSIKNAKVGTYSLLELGLNKCFRDVTLPYYQDKNIGEVLEYYFKDGSDAWILFPIGALTGINNLANLSGNQLLLLCTDKGYSRNFRIHHSKEPEISLHGAFSFKTNFHAIGQYFIQRNGKAIHQDIEQKIQTEIFSLGIAKSKASTIDYNITSEINTYSPSIYLDLITYFTINKQKSSPEIVLSLFKMSKWDPQVFSVFSDMLINWIKTAPNIIIEDIIFNLDKVSNNFYYLPFCDNIMIKLGVFYQELQDYSKAISYYKKSICYFGKDSKILLDMGICNYFLKNHENAMALFKEALKINPNYVRAKGWIQQILDDIKAEEVASI